MAQTRECEGNLRVLRRDAALPPQVNFGCDLLLMFKESLFGATLLGVDLLKETNRLRDVASRVSVLRRFA
jgi:hypothetical protein